MDLDMADTRFSSVLFSLGNVDQRQLQTDIACPPVSVFEAVGGSEDMFPGYEDASAHITSRSADQRNHPWKVSLLSLTAAQNVQHKR